MDFDTVASRTMDAAPGEKDFDIYTMGFSLDIDPDPTGALFDDDAFVAGVGTAGTLAGVGENLKGRDKNVKIIAVEPASSPVLSGGQTGAHKIQGIGAGFVPDIYIPELVDKIITITDETAFKYARLMGKEEGILVGISSGANIAAAIQVAEELGKGKKVVTVAPDGGEKYLSMGLYD